MKVAIDALPLLGRGGVSRHLMDLLPALLEQGGDHRYHLYARVFRKARWRSYRRARAAFRNEAFVWHRVLVPDRILELAWTHHDVVLPGTRRLLRGMDVFLDTTGLVPAGLRCPVVSVIHDLVPLRFPQWFPRQQLVSQRLEKQILRSSLILTVSESARRDLEDILSVAPDRVRVVRHGIHPRFRPATSDGPATLDGPEPVVRAPEVPRPYFLHVGGSGPVKNLETLLEGFHRYRRDFPRGPGLVLGGDLRWAPELPRELERLALSRDVRLLGFVEDEELVRLYRGAVAVVVASRYESFGFPALEAMACGVPVVATRVGALPELLGDDALYFEPDRPSALAERLARLASDGALRDELARRGAARASAFTWARAARETLAVLAEASRAPGTKP